MSANNSTLSGLDLSILSALPADQQKAMMALLGQAVTQAVSAASSSRTIKLNSSGGLFVRDSSFKSWSESKQKHYIASCNIPIEVAQHLFGSGANAKLVEELGKFVDANKPK